VSIDDPLLPSSSSLSALPSANPSSISLGRKSSTPSDSTTINPSNIQSALQKPEINNSSSALLAGPGENKGYRAAEAWVRPSPIATVGSVVSYGFDLKSATFTFSLTTDTACAENLPTEIYLPEFHFPPGKTAVEVSGGRWRIETEDVNEEGGMQILRWWHSVGEQNMKVVGVKRKAGTYGAGEEGEGGDGESGYFEMVREQCVLM
jgi:hypothetical protein